MSEIKHELKHNEITIYEALKNIDSGKYVMPAFQRQFVWNLEQIEKLWDSLLSDYPISTFLFWHLDECNTSKDTFFCTFMKEMVFKKSKKEPALENYSIQTIDLATTDTGVLDGQQRLTSLYLSLLGTTKLQNRSTFTSKLYIELDKNKVEENEDEVNTMTYGFSFTDKIELQSPTKFEVKKLMTEKFQDSNTRANSIEEIVKTIVPERQDYARDVLFKLCSKIYDEKVIRYSEMFGTMQDEALEMFVRFNDVGKPLKKSDITMAIFNVYWPEARERVGSLLEYSFKNFGYDFIVRTALMLYGDVVKSCIDKTVAFTLRDNWNLFKNHLSELKNLLSMFNLDLSDFSKKWNVLLPIIYLISRNPDYKENLNGIRCYLYRAMFFTYFQNGTTGKLSKLRNAINEYNFSITEELLEQIPELSLNNQKIEDILIAEKGNLTGVVLNILYADKKFPGGKYDQDHLHPRSAFDKTPPIGVSLENWREWHKYRDRLPNLQLLDKFSNQYKNDLPLIEWYNSVQQTETRENFKLEKFIPENCSLELKDFGDFYIKRKELLKNKLFELLSF